MAGAITNSRYLVQAGWRDVPHLSEAVRLELEKETPPHQRKARMEGIPSLGAGAIYPIEEEVFVVDPFQIPHYWLRSYGLDVGWNRTAAIWGARDPDQDVVYLYSEHYRGQAEPSVHAAAIKARGDWIPGVIDPAANGRSQIDGQRLLANYINLGLHLISAENSVEAGIYDVFERLSTGRLKVFRTLTNWLAEYRIYRRDEKGKVVKANDHLMDATRYYVVSGIKRGIRRPVQAITTEPGARGAADPIAGY
ncbi:phage terminase large subunit family protein [Sphingopyxis flava]|uniref:Terminase-like family protein n=1 Tax=Sphingopyxis flava TaxID=1507287 RepID=A0A1T5AC32_9SPHN|nr:terminase family protein [Sphingopyxis flava]SKB32455.1 Terminase-like family protein [Sphingopyxis flava]